MSYGIDTVREYAECYVDEGTRDTRNAIEGALNQLLFESSLSEGVGWDLFERVLTISDVMDNVPEAYERVFDYVYRNLSDRIDEYIEDHTWAVHYCDGPTVDDEYDSDELTTEDEFLDTIEVLTSEEGGWTVVERDDREVWLYDGYEGKEE